MKTLKNLVLAAVMLAAAVSAQAEWVNGHLRSNGTYVNSYYRPPANGTPYDNLSYRGYPSQQPREASAIGMLGFTPFTYTVADVGHRRFQLHDPPGRRHFFDRFGNKIPPPRIPGASGAPVFRLGNLTPGPMALSLVGFVSDLSSPGLSGSRSKFVGVGSSGEYEMADGDMYVTHARFIHADGMIHG